MRLWREHKTVDDRLIKLLERRGRRAFRLIPSAEAPITVFRRTLGAKEQP